MRKDYSKPELEKYFLSDCNDQIMTDSSTTTTPIPEYEEEIEDDGTPQPVPSNFTF